MHRRCIGIPEDARRRISLLAIVIAMVVATFALWGSPLQAQSGTVIVIRLGDRTVTVTAQQVADNADVGGARHQTRNSDGDVVDGGKYTPKAISLAKLLQLAGESGKYVQLPARGGGSLLVPPNYQGLDGPVVFWISGSGIHYFRPADKDDSEDAGSSYTTSAGELDLSVHTGNLLDVSAGVTPAKADAGERVDFNASASDKLSGEQLSYKWDFGDGATAPGRNVTHVYKKAHEWTATVTVSGDHDSMGIATVDLTVGKAPAASQNTTPNTDGRNEQQQTSGGGSGSSSPAAAVRRTLPRLRHHRRPRRRLHPRSRRPPSPRSRSASRSRSTRS